MGKAPTRAWRYRGDRYTVKQFLPYALAIGQLALAWNSLHEALAHLFWTALGGGWKGLPVGVWNAAEFDRPKRKMLRAAIEATTPRQLSYHPKMVEDMIWIINKADELENKRNDAVHSPLLLFGKGALAPRYPPLVMPDALLDNRRAINLGQKDLLVEFRWCRNATLVLRDFAYAVDRGLTTSGAPWPRRPSLPNRSAKKTPRSPRLPAQQQSRATQPPSSEG
jgi:hypothetical protein